MTPSTEKPFHEYQLIDLFKIWHDHRKFIISMTILGMLIGIITSFILPEYFRSKTILYPISMTMADRNIIFGQQQGQQEFSYFGNKYDASRILQVANSSEVIDYVINKYNLSTHYKYAKVEKYLNTKVKEEFLDNYHALKNDKDAIEITLDDTDKKMCAEIVNDIALKIDEVATRPVIEGKAKIISMLGIEYEKKKKLLDEAKKGSMLNNLENLNAEIKQLSEALTQYNVSANDKFSSITILEKAVPAEKKSRPVRWILVSVSTIGTFVFCLLLTVVMTQVRYLKGQL